MTTDLYQDDRFPERQCDYCNRRYRGPAVYCSLRCAIADSGTVPVLANWTVYERPRDYPDGYIARKWVILRGAAEPFPTNEIVVGTTLDDVRAKLPPGLAGPLLRNDDDDPKIVETWW